MEVPLISGGGASDFRRRHAGQHSSALLCNPCGYSSCSGHPVTLPRVLLPELRMPEAFLIHPEQMLTSDLTACRTLGLYSFFHWAKSAPLSWAGILLLGQNKINKPLSLFSFLSWIYLGSHNWILLQISIIPKNTMPGFLLNGWFILWLWLVRSLWKLSSAEEIKKK